MPPRIRNKGQLRKNLLRETVPTEKAGYRADVLISIALQLRKTALRLRKTTPIAKPDYLKYLEIMGKVLTLVSTLGLIIGCGMAFVYLKNIDFISVFPDVIKDPSSLITVIVVIGFLVLLFGMSFFSPYLLLLDFDIISYYKNNKFFSKKELFLILNFAILCYFLILVLILIIMQILPEWTWGETSQKIIFLIIFILPMIIIIIKSFQIRIGFIKAIKYIIFVIFIYLTPFLTLFFLLQLLVERVDDKIVQYALLLGCGGLLILNNYIIADYLSSYPRNKNNAIVIAPFFIIMPLLVGVSLAVHNFPSYVFTIIRFTEEPNYSSWYLLHNNSQKNDGTQEVSGIEKADLLRLKEKFQCPKDQEEQEICSNLPYHRNNALYGYMAWNLGNTKVFCPASVRNDKNAECKGTGQDNKCTEDEQKRANKTAFSQCLVIDGKFLQIMDEQYIGIPEKENNVSGENLQTERTISNLPSDIKIRQ